MPNRLMALRGGGRSQVRAATKASAVPATTASAPVSSRIGYGGKPLPTGTFRTVFV